MAEATDRPPRAEQTPTYESAPPAAESYRPLSLLALSGFALAIVYGLIVLVGGLVALIAGAPWLMPGWMFVLPLSGAAVSWVAGLRIRESENTLSGQLFSKWGMRLSLLFGLIYSAYYAGTFFAVRHQAFAFSDRVLEAIKQGRTEQSFLLALGAPSGDMDAKDLRDLLQVKYDQAMGPSGGGPYTHYRQSEFVRIIEMAGSDVQILRLGVVNWEYGKEGYRVMVRYQIRTPMGEFDLNVLALGRDPRPDEPKGQQWYIPLDKGGMAIVAESRKPSERGTELLHRARMAREFIVSWTNKMERGEWSAAYLDTLPPSQRPKGQDKPAVVPEWSKCIRIDKNFWAGPEQRQPILQRIKDTFKPTSQGRPSASLHIQESMPWITKENGQTRVRFDVAANYLNAQGRPEYIVAGALVVVGMDSETESSPTAWRIEAVEMFSGRTPPRMPGPNRPPGAGP